MAEPENKKPPSVDWRADRPIGSESQDKLGRSRFARHLAKAIADWNGDESLVVSLCGDWGSGKSSIKNLVLESLNGLQNSPVQVIEFNPWYWSGRESLFEVYFRDLQNALRKRADKPSRKLARRIGRYAALLGVFKTVLGGPQSKTALVLLISGITSLLGVRALDVEHLPAAVVVFGFAALVTSGLLEWGQGILVAIKSYVSSDSGRSDSLDDLKKDISSLLRTHGRSVLVVIDDVDRLTKTEIQEVFRLIKANADFPRFIYLALFQRNVVEAALGEIAANDGRGYLEKIVQVSFDVPKPRQDKIDMALFEGLDKVLESLISAKTFNQVYWGNLYNGALRGLFKDLRDVNRFLSVFEFHIGLLRTEGVLDVNPVDLIAIEAIRLFDLAFYQTIRDNKALLTGTATFISGDKKAREATIQSLVPKDSSLGSAGATELLKTLFPGVEFAFGGSQYSSESYVEWERQLRICAPKNFDRYFGEGLAEDEVSQFEIGRLTSGFSSPGELAKELERLRTEGKLPEALDRLSSTYGEFDVESTPVLLSALFDIGERLPQSPPGAVLGPEWTICRIAYRLLILAKPEQLLTAIQRVLLGTAGLGLSVMFVSLNTGERKEGISVREPLLDEKDAKAVIAIVLEKIRDAAVTERLLRRNDLLSVLYRWREWAGETEPKQWVAGVLAGSPGDCLELTAKFVQTSTIHTLGDRVVRHRKFIRYSDLEAFLRPQELEKKLLQLASSGLHQSQSEVIDLFKRCMQRHVAGKGDDDRQWSGED